MNRIIIIFLFLNIFFCQSYLANIIGGDITWRCNGNGDYIFQLRLHLKCGGPALPVSQTLSVFNHPAINAVIVNLVSQSDISPVCSNGNPVTCITGGPGAVATYLYASAPVMLGGTPPPLGGWIFTFSDCCRSNSTNLQTNLSSGLTLYSKCFAVPLNSSGPCSDDSPDFFSAPQTLLCSSQNTETNITAYDSDGDSISIKWSEPLNSFTGLFTPPSSPSPVFFNTGYSFNSPFPGPLQGAGNIAATLDPLSGELNFTSQLTGDFSYAIMVESWRCGQKIAEVMKEFQLIFTSCGNNTSPTLSTPFPGSFQTTITAGAPVTFTMTASDFSSQNITWHIYSEEFGSGFSNPGSGCNIPPCATLNPAPPIVSAGTNSVVFSWQTDCSHMGQSAICPTSEKTFRFYFTAQDDSCPVPGISTQCVLIKLIAPPVLTSPEIKCVSVTTNNDVDITWDIPPDPNSTFHHYTIFHSLNINGPFDSLTSIFNYNQNQITIPAGSGIVNQYYFIRSFGCGGFVASPPIDTIRPILLTVNNPSNGTAQLFWNDFTQPLPTTSCNEYKIYKEYPTGVWTLIDSINGNFYVDTVSVCQANINYKVTLCDLGGCVSASSIDGDLFFDQVDPVTPQLDSVSMDNAGNAVLGWTNSSSQDVIAYIIYQRFGTLYVPIDTIFGNTSTSYNYLNSNADAGSETFVIAAFDSCGNISNLGQPQNTLFLSVSYDVCNFTSTLNWNPYINMGNGGLLHYEIYVSVNGSPFVLLSNTGSLNYIHDSLQSGSTYCYRVRAKSSGGMVSSVSNRECITATAANQPSFFYLKRVTVNTSESVDLDAYIDNSPGVSIMGIDLYRSNTFGGPYTKISTTPFSGNSNISMNDNKVSVDQSTYYYFLQVRDSCDNTGIRTDTSVTMICFASANDDFTNTIQWTEYRKWLGGVNDYAIYRGINGSFDPNPIHTQVFTGAGNYEFVDDVSTLISEEGKFEYRVEAMEGPGNTFGFTAQSFSNISEAYQDAKVFVPNAFAPKGVNKMFLPVTQFVSKSDFHVRIFNRWGLLVWETTKDTEGWDGGNYEGGVYVWQIDYKNARGEYIEKIGKLVLIR